MDYEIEQLHKAKARLNFRAVVFLLGGFALAAYVSYFHNENLIAAALGLAGWIGYLAHWSLATSIAVQLDSARVMQRELGDLRRDISNISERLPANETY